MRLLSVLALVVVQVVSMSAQEVDYANLLLDFTAAFKGANAACATDSTRCDKKRIENLKQDLQSSLARAKQEADRLSLLIPTEPDWGAKSDLSKRVAALSEAIKAAEQTLGAGTTPDEEFEQALATKISDLVTEINRMNALCETRDNDCDQAELARNRFALRDLMQRAIALDDKILAETKKAKLADTPKLQARHLVLLKALEPAREISYVVHTDRTEADDLVDRLKSADAELTKSEKEQREAKDELRQARRDLKDRDIPGTEEEKKARVANARADLDEIENEQPPLRTALAELETKAKGQGVTDRKSIAKIDEELKSGNLKIDHADLVKNRKLLSGRLGELESLVTLPSDSNPLYRVFDDDYDEWWVHQFYLGGEFDSVSGILNRGFARIGYSNWLHVGGENIPESHPRSGWGNYGRTYVFNALLTSTGEQSAAKLLEPLPATDPCASNTTSTARCARRALETEYSVWAPLYRHSRHNRIRLYFGPTASIGATFVDPNENEAKSLQAGYRYYAGMRAGFARDAYGELLFGKSSTLRSHRLEVAGEIPVAKWGTKSRLLLGWSANIRAGGKEAFTRVRTTDAAGNIMQTIIPERDVYRVYISYEVDFLTLTGLQAPK